MDALPLLGRPRPGLRTVEWPLLYMHVARPDTASDGALSPLKVSSLFSTLHSERMILKISCLEYGNNA